MTSNDDDDILPATESRARLERLARLMRQAGHAESLNPVQWEALRYLLRANALSNTPGALARYLGSTKGTISQSLLALEKKGLVQKQVRGQDSRSVSLKLTPAGLAVLAKDQLLPLQADIDGLGTKTRKRFDRAIGSLLHGESLRQGEPSFGTCLTCRYYREMASGTPAHCMKVNATVAQVETVLICVEHTGR